MVKFLRIVVSSLFIFAIFHPSSATTGYTVTSFGAKSNGVTDCTQAFLHAWAAACGSVDSAIIYVPRGTYLLHPAVFEGDCRNSDIRLQIDGTLVAPADYRVLGKSNKWLSFEGVTGVSISGGTLDARGTSLWACKAASDDCPVGAMSLSFTNSKNIRINGLRSVDSQVFHMWINGCQNVHIQGVQIHAAGNSPNTDGIHVQLSRNVAIMDSTIKTGDDCISIGPGTNSLWIEDISCGPGHGISIGSLAKEKHEEGVQFVTVKNVVFTGTTNGLRIKSWARPSNGFVQGIRFLGAVMHNVENPIVIDQNYCPHHENCPGQESGIKISDVVYQNIRGTSATKIAVKFDCSSRHPCKGIKLENVDLTYQNEAAQSSCDNALGKAYGFVEPNSCL